MTLTSRYEGGSVKSTPSENLAVSWGVKSDHEIDPIFHSMRAGSESKGNSGKFELADTGLEYKSLCVSKLGPES